MNTKAEFRDASDNALVGVDVAYQGAVPREYRDLWVIRFADGRRCTAFEEWALWPGQPGTATADEE